KIGAKPNYVARRREIEGRELFAAEAQRVRASNDVVAEQLERHGRRRAEAAHELGDQSLSLRPAARSQKRERFWIARIEARDQFGDRVFPGDGLELRRPARTAAFERLRDAIRVIGDLNRRLTAHAQFALADRIAGIAFELPRQSHLHDARLSVANDFRVAFHDTYGQPAAGLTQWADARLPFGHTWHELIVGNESNQVSLRAAARGQRRGGAGDCRQFDEVAAIHQ